MMKKIFAAAAAGALLLGAGGSVALAQNPATLTQKDKKFLRQDVRGSIFEKALSQIAEQKAVSSQIKQFAQRDISDHATLDQEVQQIAQQNDVTLPTNLTHKQEKRVNRLKSLNGQAFDQAYLDDMRAINRNDMTKDQTEANDTQNPQVKRFVQHAASVDQIHENLVQGLRTA